MAPGAFASTTGSGPNANARMPAGVTASGCELHSIQSASRVVWNAVKSMPRSERITWLGGGGTSAPPGNRPCIHSVTALSAAIVHGSTEEPIVPVAGTSSCGMNGTAAAPRNDAGDRKRARVAGRLPFAHVTQPRVSPTPPPAA